MLRLDCDPITTTAKPRMQRQKATPNKGSKLTGVCWGCTAYLLGLHNLPLMVLLCCNGNTAGLQKWW